MLDPEGDPRVDCRVCVLSCLSLASLYVGSLYVWRVDLPRDHPSVIRRRCASVLLVAALSPALVKLWTCWAHVTVSGSVWGLMGLRSEGLLPAAVLPLLLTAALYFGPLVQSSLDDPRSLGEQLRSALDVPSWRLRASDPLWLRNHVVAPLTEEVVFRGAMLPMLAPCTGPTAAIFIAPLFFGVAHLHHVFEQQSLSEGRRTGVFLVSGIQFLYTTVFGVFTAFIFMRTGHVIAPVLCHSFCNSQGLPDISSALRHPQRTSVLVSYLMGVLVFLALLFPSTDRFFYGTIPVCILAPTPESACQIK